VKEPDRFLIFIYGLASFDKVSLNISDNFSSASSDIYLNVREFFILHNERILFALPIPDNVRHED